MRRRAEGAASWSRQYKINTGKLAGRDLVRVSEAVRGGAGRTVTRAP